MKLTSFALYCAQVLVVLGVIYVSHVSADSNSFSVTPTVGFTYSEYAQNYTFRVPKGITSFDLYLWSAGNAYCSGAAGRSGTFVLAAVDVSGWASQDISTSYTNNKQTALSVASQTYIVTVGRGARPGECGSNAFGATALYDGDGVLLLSIGAGASSCLKPSSLATVYNTVSPQNFQAFSGATQQYPGRFLNSSKGYANGATDSASSGGDGFVAIFYNSSCDVPPGALEFKYQPEVIVDRSGLFIDNGSPTLHLIYRIPIYYAGVAVDNFYGACSQYGVITSVQVEDCTKVVDVIYQNYQNECNFSVVNVDTFNVDTLPTLSGTLETRVFWPYDDEFFGQTIMREALSPLSFYVELDRIVSVSSNTTTSCESTCDTNLGCNECACTSCSSIASQCVCDACHTGLHCEIDKCAPTCTFTPSINVDLTCDNMYSIDSYRLPKGLKQYMSCTDNDAHTLCNPTYGSTSRLQYFWSTNNIDFTDITVTDNSDQFSFTSSITTIYVRVFDGQLYHNFTMGLGYTDKCHPWSHCSTSFTGVQCVNTLHCLNGSPAPCDVVFSIYDENVDKNLIDTNLTYNSFSTISQTASYTYYNVSYTKSDVAGNQAECTFGTVYCTTLPTIQCPPAINLYVDAGASTCNNNACLNTHTVVSGDIPVVAATSSCSSYCPVSSASSLSLSVGTVLSYTGRTTTPYTAVYTVTDPNGNTGTCSSNVFVLDRESCCPVVNCDSFIPLFTGCNSATCSVTISNDHYNYCDNTNDVTVGATSTSPEAYKDGAWNKWVVPRSGASVSIVVTDSVCTSQCTIQLNCSDNCCPTKTRCIATQSVDVDSNCMWTSNPAYKPIFADNCPDELVNDIATVLPDGTTVDLKVTRLYRFHAWDSNCTTGCDIYINPYDITAPQFTSCPTNQKIYLPRDSNTVTLNFNQGSATDNCGLVTLKSNPLVGSSFTFDTASTSQCVTIPVQSTASDDKNNTAAGVGFTIGTVPDPVSAFVLNDNVDTLTSVNRDPLSNSMHTLSESEVQHESQGSLELEERKEMNTESEHAFQTLATDAKACYINNDKTGSAFGTTNVAVNNQAFSWSLWVRFSTAQLQEYVFRIGACCAKSKVLHVSLRSLSAGTLRYGFFGENTPLDVSRTTFARSDTWIHIAGTFNGNTYTRVLYGNGVSVGSKTSAVPLFNDRLGISAQRGFDEFALFNRALSSSEIVSVYNAVNIMSVIGSQSIQLYFPFDSDYKSVAGTILAGYTLVPSGALSLSCATTVTTGVAFTTPKPTVSATKIYTDSTTLTLTGAATGAASCSWVVTPAANAVFSASSTDSCQVTVSGLHTVGLYTFKYTATKTSTPGTSQSSEASDIVTVVAGATTYSVSQDSITSTRRITWQNGAFSSTTGPRAGMKSVYISNTAGDLKKQYGLLDLANLDFSLGFSVSFAFSMTSFASGRALFECRDSVNGFRLALIFVSDATLKLSFISNTVPSQYTYSAATFTTNQWYRIVLNFGGQHIQLYVDGLLDSNTLVPTAFVPSFAFFGRSSNSEKTDIDIDYSFFDGAISSVRIYGRILANADVQALEKYGIVVDAGCNFNIEVCDNTPCSLSCPTTPITTFVNVGETCVSNPTDYATTLTDNVRAWMASTPYTIPAGSVFPYGDVTSVQGSDFPITYSVTGSAMDVSTIGCGCNFNVTVNDVCGSCYVSSGEECDGGDGCKSDCTCDAGYGPVHGCFGGPDPSCGATTNDPSRSIFVSGSSCSLRFDYTSAPTTNKDTILAVRMPLDTIYYQEDGLDVASVDRVVRLQQTMCGTTKLNITGGEFLKLTSCCPTTCGQYQEAYIKVAGSYVNTTAHCLANGVTAALSARSYDYSTGCFTFPLCEVHNAVTVVVARPQLLAQCPFFDNMGGSFTVDLGNFTTSLSVDSSTNFKASVSWNVSALFRPLSGYTVLPDGEPTNTNELGLIYYVGGVRKISAPNSWYASGSYVVEHRFTDANCTSGICTFFVKFHVADGCSPSCPTLDNVGLNIISSTCVCPGPTSIDYTPISIAFTDETSPLVLTAVSYKRVFYVENRLHLATVGTVIGNTGLVTLDARSIAQVEYEIVDTAGNKNTCTYNVSVADKIAPCCPVTTTYTYSNDEGMSYATKNVVESLTFCDNLDSNFAVTPNTPSNYPITSTLTSCSPQQTSVDITVTDSDGNSRSCPVNVKVEDVNLPVIYFSNVSDFTTNPVCGRENIVVINTSTQTKCVDLTKYVKYSDNDDLTKTCHFSTKFREAGSISDIADPTNYCLLNCCEKTDSVIVYTVSDTYGSRTCTIIVALNDTATPTLSCPVAVTQNVDSASFSCPATSVASCPVLTTCTVSLSQPTVYDTCGCAATNIIQRTDDFGSTFPLGTTTASYDVKDAGGNTNACTTSVTCSDNIAPCVWCPASYHLYTSQGGVEDKTASSCDNVNVASAVVKTYEDEVCNDNSDIVKIVQHIYTAKDAAGNSALCSWTVTFHNDLCDSHTLTYCPESSSLDLTDDSPYRTYSYDIAELHPPIANYTSDLSATTYDYTFDAGLTIPGATNSGAAFIDSLDGRTGILSTMPENSFYTLPVITFGGSAISVRVVYKPVSLVWSYRLFEFGNGEANMNFLVELDSWGTIVVYHRPGTVYNFFYVQRYITPAHLNTWIDFVVTVSATGYCKVYRNGLKFAEFDFVPIMAGTRTVNLLGKGSWPTDPLQKAFWDRVTVFDGVLLTANDVSGFYVAHKPSCTDFTSYSGFVSGSYPTKVGNGCSSWQGGSCDHEPSPSLFSSSSGYSNLYIGNNAFTFNAKNRRGKDLCSSCTFNVDVNDVTSPLISAYPAQTDCPTAATSKAQFSLGVASDNSGCFQEKYVITGVDKNGQSINQILCSFAALQDYSFKCQVAYTVYYNIVDASQKQNSDYSFPVWVDCPTPSPVLAGVLSKVRITKRAGVTDGYRAALQITSIVPYPFNTFASNASVTENTPTLCDSTTSTCRQTFDLSYDWVGCTLSQTEIPVSFSVELQSYGLFQCDVASQKYSKQLKLVLNANNFCAKKLSSVKLKAYIVTVADDATTGLTSTTGTPFANFQSYLAATKTVAPGATIAIPTNLDTILVNQNLSSLVIVNQTAVGALVNDVTLKEFKKMYYNEASRTTLNKTVVLVTNGVLTDASASETSRATQYSFVRYKETPIMTFPQKTFYSTLIGTISVTYKLGPTTRRRLLTFADRVAADGSQVNSGRRQVERLESSDTTAESKVVAMSLDEVPSNAFAQGGNGLALVVLRVTSSADNTALAKSVQIAVSKALSLPVDAVRAYVVPGSRSGAQTLVQLVYQQTSAAIVFMSGSKFASTVQQQVVDANSALQTELAKASVDTDINFFYTGIVRDVSTSSTTTTPTATTIVISNSSSGIFSASTSTAILIVASLVMVMSIGYVAFYHIRARARSSTHNNVLPVANHFNSAVPGKGENAFSVWGTAAEGGMQFAGVEY